jgi:hypothetical protein
MPTETLQFACDSCARKFVWKPELAGKRARCKCGKVLEVPRELSPPEPEPEPETEPMSERPAEEEGSAGDGFYDFAVVEPPPSPKPVLPVATASATRSRTDKSTSNSKPKQRAATAAPVGYFGAAVQPKKDRFSLDNLVDMPRDVYLPSGLLGVGFLLNVAYVATVYHLSAGTMQLAFILLLAITFLKTACLIGFAFLIAGPVGVSFGGLWTAILKLASMAVFCDGAAVWCDHMVTQAAGIRGPGTYIAGALVALVVYLTLFSYLFQMDSTEAWTVTRVLFLSDRILRWILFFVLITALPALAITPRGRGAAMVSPIAASDPMAANVQMLKDRGQLMEARAYLAQGNQAVLKGPVNDWYAAGCPNVWFEMSPADINGRSSALDVIVELPADPASRVKCMATLKSYYDSVQIPTNPLMLKDTGQAYLMVLMR